jgi:hypothetical protein
MELLRGVSAANNFVLALVTLLPSRLFNSRLRAGGDGVSNARTTMMSWLTAAITGQRRRGGGATPADCGCFAIAKSNVAGFEYEYGGG